MSYLQVGSVQGDVDALGAILRYPCVGGLSASGLAGTPYRVWGIAGQVITTTGTNTVVRDDDGVLNRTTSTTALNNDAGTFYSASTVAVWEAFPDATFKIGRITTTGTRAFVGLATFASLAGGNSADSPSGSYVGLQFSTARGDLNWQVARDDGSGQVLVDSGVAPLVSPASGAHYLRLTTTEVLGVVEVTVSILDETYGVLFGPTTYAASVPQSGLANPFFGVRNLIAGTARSIECYGVAWMRMKGPVTGP